ncbi:MAG: GNAT family N-acetyltransferase [Gammaproteobacteria bacterium]|nr:GNAT family N-acetyltransferase [Gammaproteobacteria bacterium]
MYNIDIREINSSAVLPLRHQVLWPNKPIEFCKVADDWIAWHFGAFIEERLVSVASVYPKGNTARLRKFATLQDYQARGIGSQVLLHILKQLQSRGITLFWCDARESALKFYEKFGMKSEGERFYKSDVPYYKMCLMLNNE